MRFDDDITRLAGQVGQLLSARAERVATAESCTGGLVAAAITSVAGSSHWFHGGYVTYDNAIKHALLDVDTTTLAREGAVSEATVRQMAAGALDGVASHWALAVSGIAGPGGAVPGKPVGTVWFGLAQRLPTGEARTLATVRRFEGDRDQVRDRSVRFVLHWLLTELEAATVVV